MNGHEYPIYSEPPNDRNKIVIVLLIFSFLVFGVFQLLATGSFREILSVTSFLTASGPITIFGFLYWIFDKSLWKGRLGALVFGLLHQGRPPCLAGDYRVTIRWMAPHNDPARQTGESKGVMTIIQTWRRIAVQMSIRDSPDAPARGRSSSKMALLEATADDRQVILSHTYEFEGEDPKLVGRNEKISGTAKLVFDRVGNGKWVVTGRYYGDDGGSGTIYSAP